MEEIYLLLGTNIGLLEDNLHRTLSKIQEHGIEITAESRVFRTRPWGEPDQNDFLNQALAVSTDKNPETLVRILKGIEQQMGRTPGPKWGPRVIDIDILFYGRRKVNNAILKIPHPHFFRRPFAIVALADIAPRFRPPGKRCPLTALAREADHEGIEVHRH